ncbi:hypothetical protein VKT23_010597 [Stygiomarasmius scandens]|uniref:Uncharacterized protein n=1 Tax=Marasmiellus scandens TaxID=2682957 RepID=A0ABR1JFX4_9AGAR
MRFDLSTIVSTIATVASLVNASSQLASRQEAARFGSVSVTPCPLSGGEHVTITYNATTAARAGDQPQFVDFYVQGTSTLDPPKLTNKFLLQRNSFGPDQVLLTLDTTIPEAINNPGIDGTDWNILAMITFDQDGLLIDGGVFSFCPQ